MDYPGESQWTCPRERLRDWDAVAIEEFSLRKNLMLCEDDDCVRLPAALPHALLSRQWRSGSSDHQTHFLSSCHRTARLTSLFAWNCAPLPHGGGNVRGARSEGQQRMVPVNTSHSACKKRCDERQETHLLQLEPSPSAPSVVPSPSSCLPIEGNRVQLFASLLLLLGALTSACAAGPDASHARINNPQQKCDRMFASSPGSAKNGSITSPSFQNSANHSRQCIYTFHAAENERVEVTFTSFNLRGAHPEYVSNTKNTERRKKKETCPFLSPPSLFA